ncbi:MAG: hypothetical protein AAGA56_05995 [Myxococcota bacterium]
MGSIAAGAFYTEHPAGPKSEATPVMISGPRVTRAGERIEEGIDGGYGRRCRSSLRKRGCRWSSRRPVDDRVAVRAPSGMGIEAGVTP